MFTVTLQLDIPQLTALTASLDALNGHLRAGMAFGGSLMASLESITAAIQSFRDEFATVFATEMEQLAAKLAGSPTQEEVEGVAADILMLRDNVVAAISGMIPDEGPPPDEEEPPADAGPAA